MADELKAYEIRNIEGLWEDERVKGRGSFGSVYEVKANGVPCIAKRLHDILQGFGRYEAVGSQEKTALRANFRRECVIMSKLRHPNIVQFLGVYYGRREGDLALLMEYLHTDLDRCLTDNPDVPLPIKISILLDVSYGLLYLHTQNPEIIHRDLKAENVLLTTDMRAKLADLGVAKIINLRTCKQSHTIAPGTNAVMPPEALQANPHYNYKLDVFSFGALTVHVVTQEFPEVHEVPFESMQRGRVQIAKRMSVIQKMSQGHCLYPTAMECLLDDQNERPTTQSLNERLKKLSDQHPRQFQDFLHIHRELHKQRETHSEDIVKLKKEMADFKTYSFQEVQLLRGELADKQDEITQLTKQVEQKDLEVIQMGNQYQSTRLELEENINLLRKQVFESAKRVGTMKDETSRLRTLNQASVNRCERILEEKTSLIRKYEQSSSHVHQKLEEAARVARKQMEDLQAVLVQAVANAQQEVEEMHKSRSTILVTDFDSSNTSHVPVNSGEFNVSQLQQEKQDMALDYERQLLEMKEQLQTVTSERDELKQNQERLNAHWESQVRRLEQQLQNSGAGKQPTGEYYDNGMTRAQLESAQETITQLESQLNTLKRQRSRESQMGREAQTARDLEKELNEVKDRNAALQSQLTEYAGVISDQSKVIQSGKVQDSEYVHLQQHHIHLGEYLKKQQLEYEEALSSLKKKISSISKLGDENLKIHQLNVNLTAELEDYRTQTKRLLADLRQKDSELAQRDTELAQRYAELAQRDAEIGQLREQRGYYSSSSSDRDQMELDMLRQKCDAWREEVEKLAPLRDEVGRLHTHIGGLEEQIRSLQTDNENLGKQLQSVVEESERKQVETYRKAPPDYDNIRSQLAELQQVRVQLENELVPLREERTRILTENARLREGTQPEKYANLKKNYEALDEHCIQLEKALEEEKALVERLCDTNSRMQKQLAKCEQEANTLASKAQDYEARMRRYRDERNQAQLANKALQEQINTLEAAVQDLNSQLQSKYQVAASLTSMQISSGREGEDKKGVYWGAVSVGERQEQNEASGVGPASEQIKPQDTESDVKPVKQLLCATTGCSSKAVPELGGWCTECYENISMYT